MSIKSLRDAMARFPKMDLGTLPTPLHRLRGFERSVQRSDIWIKRDDLTGLALGGNKVRTLEYLVGEALSAKADTLVVGGPPQSNMCAITAAAARKAGLECITVHNGAIPEKLEGNLALLSLLNVESHFIGEKNQHEREVFVREIATELRTKSRSPYVIENGGSTALGSLGYVWAAVELHEQITQSGLNIKHVFMPCGNGGAVAGLIAGTGLIDIPFHVHVISVEHPGGIIKEIIREFVGEIGEILGLGTPYHLDQTMTIHDEYMGDGWGKDTSESRAMVNEFPQKEGIFIENVYTSKTMFGMLDLAENGAIPETEGICYIHTGGLPSLFAQIQTAQ